MLIRSQNKRKITNNLNLSIKTEERIMSNCLKEEFPRQEMFRIVDSKDIPLGDYSTEEKAIKVLDMIQDAYTKCESARTLTTGTVFKIARESKTQEVVEDFKKAHRDNFVFQMPQDSEV